jgi:AcrR family transcriptional regulator
VLTVAVLAQLAAADRPAAGPTPWRGGRGGGVMAAVAAAPASARRNWARPEGSCRDEIITAASQMIRGTGDYSALTLGRGARRLGIAAPTICRHFTHVGELKMPVVQRAFAGFVRARGAASGDGDDLAARLLARCRAYTAFALANPGPYRYVFSQQPTTGGPARPRVVGMPVFHALAESISRCQQPD